MWIEGLEFPGAGIAGQDVVSPTQLNSGAIATKPSLPRSWCLFLSFLKTYLFPYMGVLSACTSSAHQKRALGPMGLQLQMVESHYVGAGN